MIRKCDIEKRVDRAAPRPTYGYGLTNRDKGRRALHRATKCIV